MADVLGLYGLVVICLFALPLYWKQLSRDAVGLMLFKGNRLVFTILMPFPATVVTGGKGLVQHEHPGPRGKSTAAPSVCPRFRDMLQSWGLVAAFQVAKLIHLAINGQGFGNWQQVPSIFWPGIWGLLSKGSTWVLLCTWIPRWTDEPRSVTQSTWNL